MVYMDNASTHPLEDDTKEYLKELLNIFGNPSSQHTIGDKAKQIINETRSEVAKFINADEECVYFTSGGCASNTAGIRGFIQANEDTMVFYSPIAHKSVLKAVPLNSLPLKVTNKGYICLEELEESLIRCNNINKLVVIDYANSEIGTVQNMGLITEMCHKYNAIVMVDCTGSISSIPINLMENDFDIVTFSGHKLGALKGIGVFYKKKDINITPLIYGSQEQGLFAGTENVLGIGSLGYVIKNYSYARAKSVTYVRNNLVDLLTSTIDDCYLVGETDLDKRLPNNIYMCFKGVDATGLLTLLSSSDICVSTGSACNSGNQEPSPTLSAIGFNKEDIFSCIRFSLSYMNTTAEAEYVSKITKGYVETLRQM